MVLYCQVHFTKYWSCKTSLSDNLRGLTNLVKQLVLRRLEEINRFQSLELAESNSEIREID